MDNENLLSSKRRPPPKLKLGITASEGTQLSVTYQNLEPALERSKVAGAKEEDLPEPTNQIEKILRDLSMQKGSAKKIEEMKKRIKEVLQDKTYSKAKEPLSAPDSHFCEISNDGNTIVSGSIAGEIRIFTRNGAGSDFKLEQTLSVKNEGEVSAVCLTENKDIFFASEVDEEKGTIFMSRKINGRKWAQPEVIGGHKQWVNSLATTLDGGTLFSGSDDQTIKVWRSNRGVGKYEEIQTLQNHESKIFAVSVTDDGSTLFSGDESGKIMVWNRNEGGEEKPSQYDLNPQILPDHTNVVTSLSSTPDGGIFVSGSDDDTVRVWEKGVFGSYNCLQVLKSHSWQVNDVSISNDGKRIFSGSGDRTCILWMSKPDSQSLYFTQDQVVIGNPTIVENVAMSGSGGTLVLSGKDDELIVYGRRKNIKFQETKSSLSVALNKHSADSDNLQSESDLASTEDGRILFSVYDDKSIIVWKKPKEGTGSHEETQILQEVHQDLIQSLRVTSKGDTLFSASEDKTVNIFRRDHNGDYQSTQTLSGHNDGILALAVTPDGSTLFSTGRDAVILVWVRNEKHEYILHERLEGHINEIWGLDVTVDGNTLVSVSGDLTLRVWRKGQKNIKESQNEKENEKKSFSYSMIQVLYGHSKTIHRVAISRKGKTIVTGSRDETVCVWILKKQADDRKFVHHQTLHGHEGGITSLCLSNDANTIISGANDENLKIWQKSGHSYTFNSGYDHPGILQGLFLKQNKIYSNSREASHIKPASIKFSFFESIFKSDYYSSLFYQALSKPTNIQPS